MSNRRGGHFLNVANFQKLIAVCTGFGTLYNPSRTAISIESLELLAQQAETALTNANVATLAYRDKLNQRREEFADLSMISSRVVNALASTGVSAKSVKDARTLYRKIQGYRQQSTEVKDTQSNETPVTKYSTTQLSFDARLENFEKLIEILKLHAEYNPNEADLKIPQLEAYAMSLNASNLAANTSAVSEYNTRLIRNTALYAPEIGIYDIANAVKSYVKSVFGTSSPQMKKVIAIQFTTI